MQREEFENMTGIYPSNRQYKAIEDAYYKSNVTKEVFCTLYRRNKDGLAEMIRVAADMQDGKEKREREEEIETLKARIAELEKRLDAELEWKEYHYSREIAQEDYDRVARYGRKLTDEEAMQLVVNNAGFERARVDIVHDFPEVEINKYSEFRKTGKYLDRAPLMFADDVYYIRFTVACKQGIALYELKDGWLDRLV